MYTPRSLRTRQICLHNDVVRGDFLQLRNRKHPEHHTAKETDKHKLMLLNTDVSLLHNKIKYIEEEKIIRKKINYNK